MYKRILLPVDGSELSRYAFESAIALAKEVGAQVFAFHVICLPSHEQQQTWLAQVGDFSDRRQAYFEKMGLEYVNAVAKAALAAGVSCNCVLAHSNEPAQAILDAAREHQCDLIYMAPRGRTRDLGMQIGNEVIKVLAHSRIPVLIYRPSETPTGNQAAPSTDAQTPQTSHMLV